MRRTSPKTTTTYLQSLPKSLWGWYTGYWTSWSLTAFALDFLAGWKLRDDVFVVDNVRMMLCVSSVGGLWIAFVKRRLVVPEGILPNWAGVREITGIPALVLLDIFTHQLPLAVFMARHPSEYLHPFPQNYMLCYILLVIYCRYHDPESKYMVSWRDMFYGLIVAHVLNYYLMLAYI